MPANKKIKFYVVDFERELIRRVEELFTHFPQYNITYAGSSQNYYGCLNDAPKWGDVDVFLISAFLSDLMGVELIKPIRSKNPNAKIIISVKSNTLNQAEEAMRKGADKVLTKPIAAIELIEAIHELTADRFQLAAPEDSNEPLSSFEEYMEFESNLPAPPANPSSRTSEDHSYLQANDSSSYEEESDDADEEADDNYFSQLIEENLSYDKTYFPEEKTKPSLEKPKEAPSTKKPSSDRKKDARDIYNPTNSPLYAKTDDDDYFGKKPNYVVVNASVSSSGKTSLLVNSAIAIRKYSQYKPKIVIVDFNLLFPSVFLKFDHNDMLLCKKNIYELIEDIDDLSDEDIEEALITHQPTGIKILYTPRDVVRAQEIDQEIIEKIVTHLRSMFDLVLIDTSSNFELPSNSFPLVISDKNIVILEPDVTSVLHTGRLMELIQNIELNMETSILSKTQFVLNKQKNKTLIELEDIKDTLQGSEIRFIIPEDPKILDYGNNGLSVIDYPSTSTRYIKELARNIYPFETEFNISDKKKEKPAGKKGFNFNLFGKK